MRGQTARLKRFLSLFQIQKFDLMIGQPLAEHQTILVDDNKKTRAILATQTDDLKLLWKEVKRMELQKELFAAEKDLEDAERIGTRQVVRWVDGCWQYRPVKTIRVDARNRVEKCRAKLDEFMKAHPDA